MDSLRLLGIFLIQMCVFSSVYALPTNTENSINDVVISGTTETPAIVSVTQGTPISSEQKNDKYLSRDWSESVAPFNVSYSAAERKQHLKQLIQSKIKNQPLKRRRGNRRANNNRMPSSESRTTETPTTKPTKIYIQMPNMFISQSWGPG